MITRTPPMINSKPALQILAVGKFEAGNRELQAHSLFQPRTVVEHVVNRWTDEKWIAEVRVDQRLKERGIFRGEQGYADAVEWCDALEPLADLIPTPIIRLHVYESDVEAVFDEMFAKPGLDYAPTSAYAPEVPVDWAAFLVHAAEAEWMEAEADDLEDDMQEREWKYRGC